MIAANHPLGIRPTSSNAVAMRASTRRTTSTMNSVNSDRLADRLERRLRTCPTTAIAVASAIRNQAVTSSIAAHAIVSAPTGRLIIRRSARIRASTGNAVIDIDTPMNSANATNFLSGPTQLVQRQRDRDAEQHRDRDARVRDRRGLRDLALELAAVDLEPDQEHVEDQPEVRDRADRGQRVGWEERGLQVGRDRAQQRRAEHQSGDHLAHHARLADLGGDVAEDPADDQHDREREEHGCDEVVEVTALLGRGELLARRAEARRSGQHRLGRRDLRRHRGGHLERESR